VALLHSGRVDVGNLPAGGLRAMFTVVGG